MCIAHDMRLLADVADRLVVLDGGRPIADDTPRAVFADAEVMTRAGLRPPQVTRLALRLDGPTRPWPALGVDEVAGRAARRIRAPGRLRGDRHDLGTAATSRAGLRRGRARGCIG